LPTGSDNGEAPAHATRPSGHVRSEGAKIAFYETGAGLPLLLINGGPGFPARHFAPLAERLAAERGRRVIRFDQRGTGSSTLEPLSAETLTLAAMVRDIEALRLGLGIDRWSVMGHSFGGVLAMAYAASHPAPVRTLILSAPAGVDLSYRSRLSANIQTRLTAEERSALAAVSADAAPSYERQLEALSVLLSAYVQDRSQLPALRRAVVDSRVYVPAVAAFVSQNMEREHDLRPGLRHLRKPAVIIQGDHDPLGLETAQDVQSAIAGSRLIIIPNASHYAWLDNPSAYFEAVGLGL
jgi:proline iminopeptidase